MSKKDGIKVSFVGENSADVTGSCIWIKTPHRQILLECGLWQSAGSTLEAYKINNAHLEFDPKKIDYVFVGHTHIDHCGKIPLLCKKGFESKIIIPEGTRDIMSILLYDSAKIADSDAQELSTKFNRDYQPLYTEQNVDRAMYLMKEYPFEEIIELDEYVKFRFVPSGHIMNSAQIELWITEGNITKKIAYTSDLGNVHVKKYFTNQFRRIDRADIVISECTYGGEDRIATQKVRDKDIEKLKSVIENVCINNKGRVLIPVFANSRAQEVLATLFDIFGNDENFKVPVLFDTPMGIKICDVYKSILKGEDADKWEKASSWKNVKFIVDADESRAAQSFVSPAIILSSSGMMTHGRSRAWCKSVLPNSDNSIVFCGFSVDNSLASIIKRGEAKTIKLNGRRVANRCNVVDLHSFSSHMQQDSLLSMLSSIDCEKVLLVHGEMNGKLEFAKKLVEKISKNDKTSKVVVVNKGYSINI